MNSIILSLLFVIAIVKAAFPLSGEITVRLNSDAYLPCDTSIPSPGDSVAVILWFKDENSLPIYSIDARDPNVKPVHRKSALGTEQARFEFIESGRLSYLHIRRVKISDSGIYRCRVDLRLSRTRNTALKLDVT